MKPREPLTFEKLRDRMGVVSSFVFPRGRICRHPVLVTVLSYQPMTLKLKIQCRGESGSGEYWVVKFSGYQGKTALRYWWVKDRKVRCGEHLSHMSALVGEALMEAMRAEHSMWASMMDTLSTLETRSCGCWRKGKLR